MMQKQWRLAARPDGIPDRSHFSLTDAPIPALQPGKAVAKTLYLGVAPVMLRYMRNETEFESPLALGTVMPGSWRRANQLKATVIHCPLGQLCKPVSGWQEYALIDDSDRPAPFLLPTDLPLSPWHRCRLVIGYYRRWSGFAISEGLLPPIAFSSRVQPVGWAVTSQKLPKRWGFTKSSGSLAGQKKCARLRHDMAYDHVIDYKNDDVDLALNTLFPEGIDLYFDNVGGALLDNVLARLRRRARIVICGSISEYLTEAEDKHHFINLQNLGRQDAKMEGFFVFDYEDMYPQCLQPTGNLGARRHAESSGRYFTRHRDAARRISRFVSRQ